MQDDQASRRTAAAAESPDRQKDALIRLQAALEAEGFESVLVGRRTLALRGQGPTQLSRPWSPELHVIGTVPCHIVTTDGRYYRPGLRRVP